MPQTNRYLKYIFIILTIFVFFPKIAKKIEIFASKRWGEKSVEEWSVRNMLEMDNDVFCVFFSE